MIIIHGVYRWWPKRVAFRNDYCLSCEAPRRAIATRTFDVGHIFWVPLIPVGFWKHWSCAVCRRDPHAATKTRRPFKWIGLVCLVLLSAMFWATPIDAEVAWLGWLLRLAPLAGAVALLIQLLRTSAEPSLKQRLVAIPPASDMSCPFCATPLIAGSGARWSCPQCGAERW
ncbi:MAG TPA: hypothetical protein VMH04_01835 [Candidatus Solibacter sp.]|nr:hypothetical protein [Candidatus Solibacter sp.]